VSIPHRRNGHIHSPKQPGCALFKVTIVDEDSFHKALRLERKRSGRNGRPFLLLLVSYDARAATSQNDATLHTVAQVLPSLTRETDVVGWYQMGSIVGVLFTEVTGRSLPLLRDTLVPRLLKGLSDCIDPHQLETLMLSARLVLGFSDIDITPLDRLFSFTSDPTHVVN
jgi:hypothetical protein